MADRDFRPWQERASALDAHKERPATRPDEVVGVLHAIEFVPENDERDAGTYITIRVDDPDLRWSAGRVALRYLVR
jgi:hypothetical protein